MYVNISLFYFSVELEVTLVLTSLFAISIATSDPQI